MPTGSRVASGGNGLGTPNRRRAYLFGNGLSVAFNPEHYRLEQLTRAVRDRLAELHTPDGEPLLVQVDGIVEAIATDRERNMPADSFEALAGPIDRLATMFQQVGPLAALLERKEDAAALQNVGTILRVLYKRVVGAVLERVMMHVPGPDGWNELNAMARYLVSEARRQGILNVFVLNYDAILDSALLMNNPPDVSLIDEFQGFGARNIFVYTPDGNVAEIPGLPWRAIPFYPPLTELRYHHLHGAGMWMRFQGNVYKARHIEGMRSCGLYQAWAEGLEGQEIEGQVEPVVLLGDQKENWAALWPFSETYARLTNAVGQADEVVIAGYGFRDYPINRVIATGVRPETMVTVVNPAPGIERIARTALGLRQGLRVIEESLPLGLLAID
jgi:hypothetical protein